MWLAMNVAAPASTTTYHVPGFLRIWKAYGYHFNHFNLSEAAGCSCAIRIKP